MQGGGQGGPQTPPPPQPPPPRPSPCRAPRRQPPACQRPGPGGAAGCVPRPSGGSVGVGRGGRGGGFGGPGRGWDPPVPGRVSPGAGPRRCGRSPGCRADGAGPEGAARPRRAPAGKARPRPAAPLPPTPGCLRGGGGEGGVLWYPSGAPPGPCVCPARLRPPSPVPSGRGSSGGGGSRRCLLASRVSQRRRRRRPMGLGGAERAERPTALPHTGPGGPPLMTSSRPYPGRAAPLPPLPPSGAL